MKKNGKKNLLFGVILLATFVIWTALIQIVDVQPLGQNGTNIGFATFNCWFHRLTGVHMTLYTITDWMGLVPIFEIIPINYRPILIEGVMEASYPSSTTLLILCVMPTLIEQIQRRLTCVTTKRIITITVIAFSVFMVIGRLISGVHWFTDIVVMLSTKNQ